MARGYDEPFTLYGLLAERSRPTTARSYVTFRSIRPRAFSDGKPVTAEDVLFSWQLLRDKGRPNSSHLLRQGRQGRGARRAHRAVRSRRRRRPRTAADPRPDAGAAEARHQSRTPSRRPASTPPLGTGPYRVSAVDPGRERHAHAQSRLLGPRSADQSRPVEFRRDPARLLPRRQRASSRRSSAASTTSASRPTRCAGTTATTFPRRATAASSRRRSPTGLPQGMSDFCVQHAAAAVRRHPRARGAHAAVRFRMDQPATTSSACTGAPPSYFAGSELSAYGRPADARERELLAPFPGAVRADILDGTLVAAGDRRLRPRPRQRCAARSRCSTAAGYELDGTVAAPPRAAASRSRFEILVTTRDQERLALAFAATSSAPASTRSVRVGRRRAVRPAPARLRFRHDPEPLGPVAVARQRAGVLLGVGGRRRATARRNYMGAKDPAIDAMIAAMLEAPRASRFRRRGARARPRADLGLLRRSAFPRAGTMGGALVLYPSS